ncbi:MAG: short-chain fatty acid transporter [Gammaproteobacteria bacterium]|nr:short-chain fatty acid transporter [Gammaproteobacteria bacterium]
MLLQYPLYGGMMGLMMNSGLTQQFSEIITQVSSAETLPFFGFISAGIVNLAIPSGGAQWALQGPIFIEAAHSLGVDIRIIAMSIAWGDQWTNIIQPFVAIPLIAMAGVKLRQIYSYCLILLCTTFFAFNLGLFLATTAF